MAALPENDSSWDLYWEMRLQAMEDLGKREAILTGSRLIRQLAAQTRQPMRLLELGCGEAQIIGMLVDAHSQECPPGLSVGVDYNSRSLATCRRDYPQMRFIQGDFTDPALLESLGEFELVLLVNALHEVFSAAYSDELGETDVPVGKAGVVRAFAGAVERLAPGGYLLLFDGLEMPGDLQTRVKLRFLDPQARQHFDTFASEYRPFQISYQQLAGPDIVELSQRDFTRYITKSIFLGKHLWPQEQLESYQYYNRDEFQARFDQHGLQIHQMRTLTMNEDKWRSKVEILTPGVQFPAEHILILAQKV